MKLPRPGVMALAFMLLCSPAPCAGEGEGFFPEIPGFSKQDRPRSYDPDDLFEYINGDAFSYLNFGFEKVTVQDYGSEQGNALTVDVYRHSSDNNGFGIYSHERPADAAPLPIGAEGYCKEGILNFYKGSYYVKLRSHDVVDLSESLLKSIAGKVAMKIEGKDSLPMTASAFPEEGMVPNSLRYMGSGFLGHGFLHSAFVADYEAGEARLQLFIIEAADEDAADGMLQDYLALVERKEGSHTLDEGTYRFVDPYHASRGAMNLRRAGNYLFGLFSDDKVVADSYLKTIERNMKGLRHFATVVDASVY